MAVLSSRTYRKSHSGSWDACFGIRTPVPPLADPVEPVPIENL